MEFQTNYDCVVIGGGPAGSTVAALIAGAGSKTLLVEQDTSPRRRLGESLLPACRGTLSRLGLLDEIEQGGFSVPTGIQFFDSEGTLKHSVGFCTAGADATHGWYAPRPQFDQLLFENAAARGAVCLRGTRVADILFDGPRAIGVRVHPPQGDLQEVRARIIVDAAGRQSPIARCLNLHIPDSRCQRIAMWGYYRGGVRDHGGLRSTTQFFRARHRRAWFWYVPLPDSLVNVGVVGDAAALTSHDQVAAAFEEELVNCPAVAQRLMSADLISPLRVARNFCYSARQADGPGWVLVGDALAGIDPLLCAGATLALKNGEWAADAIVAQLKGGGAPESLAEPWVAQQSAATARLGCLAELLHSPDFEPGVIAARFPQHTAALGRLLGGHVFSSDGDATLAELSPFSPSPMLWPANS